MVDISANICFKNVRPSWGDQTRVFSWSMPRLMLFSTGCLAVIFLSFSAGAWLGKRLDPDPANTLVVEPAVEQEQPAAKEAYLYNADEARPVQPEGGHFTRTLSHKIQKNDNLYDALQEFGVSSTVIREWTRISRQHYNLSRVRPGQSFDLCLDENDKPFLFVFHVSPALHLVIESKTDRTGEPGSFTSRLDKKAPDIPQTGIARPELVPVSFRYVDNRLQIRDPVTGDWRAPDKTTVKRVATFAGGKRTYNGTVTGSFYKAAEEAGLSASQIMELIEIYACEIDFKRQIRKGDAFKVLAGWPGPNTVNGAEEIILASMIETGGKPHWAFYYEGGGSKPGYYDENGNSLKGFNLMCPVRYTRISSGYSYRRLHPILKIYRPHLAIDYAAPAGTPVRAAAAGTVEHAAWKGGYGRYVKIRHNSKYTTGYGHLLRYAKGIRKGTRVKQGQIIGYVGSSGLATGSHLDYQVLRYGKPINPLRFYGEKGSQVASMNAFQNAKARLIHEMKSIQTASAANPVYTSTTY